jgi:hypothetical protein
MGIDAIAEPDELILMLVIGYLVTQITNKIDNSSSSKSTKRIVGNFTLFCSVFMHPVSDMPIEFRKLY